MENQNWNPGDPKSTHAEGDANTYAQARTTMEFT
jgi:hypothetical protein